MSDFKPTRLGPQDPPPETPWDGSRASMDLLVHKIVGLESRIGDRVGVLLEDFKKELRLELHEEIRLLVPNGDVEGHRKAHESMIAAADRWQRFRYSMFEHVAKTIGLAIVLFIAVAVWDAVKKGLTQ